MWGRGNPGTARVRGASGVSRLQAEPPGVCLEAVGPDAHCAGVWPASCGRAADGPGAEGSTAAPGLAPASCARGQRPPRPVSRAERPPAVRAGEPAQLGSCFLARRAAALVSLSFHVCAMGGQLSRPGAMGALSSELRLHVRLAPVVCLSAFPNVGPSPPVQCVREQSSLRWEPRLCLRAPSTAHGPGCA